jgi:hypothetical protein
MVYLVEHRACDCDTWTPQPCATAQDVAVYLWGRDVTQHVVWMGECPYQFHIGDVRLIQALLDDCPVAAIRPYLPCALWAGSQVLVVIGWVDVEARRPLRDISYMTWIDTMGRRSSMEKGSTPGRLTTHRATALWRYRCYADPRMFVPWEQVPDDLQAAVLTCGGLPCADREPGVPGPWCHHCLYEDVEELDTPSPEAAPGHRREAPPMRFLDPRVAEM